MERPSYVSTVMTDGHSYWQRGSNPQLQYETPVGGPKDPPDGYRVTNMHLGQTAEINQIEETEKENAAMAAEQQRAYGWVTATWTVITCLLCPCCIYCTLGALLCTVFGYVDHKSRDYRRQNSKLRWALIISTAVFVAGVVAVVIILAVLFSVYQAQSWSSVPTVPGFDYTM